MDKISLANAHLPQLIGLVLMSFSQSVFDNHVRAPRAYNGNDYDSAYKHLVLRYSMNQKKNHSLTGYVTESNGRTHLHKEIIDQTLDQSYTANGLALGFESLASGLYHYNWSVDENQYEMPSLPYRRPVDKIRIEQNFVYKS